ncbi:MAG: hypothetical protein IT272_06300 [Chitinophagales bacterium]|jgi:photosystem II stability/assembly factor-like uncharacterized protein|nr:hypothetical protein [Sphingobacteriales bacterium]MBK8678756.1 hypothetical protein [Sphingobacteriales bacterium]MBL0246502.1 hypothetical protein [Sphingobacteriales bacterium]MBP9140746.1 hypothetical protein [Chitinophagales bacterium]MCC7057005.1 hypothetical protein [Chitinophagales bacterium]
MSLHLKTCQLFASIRDIGLWFLCICLLTVLSEQFLTAQNNNNAGAAYIVEPPINANDPNLPNWVKLLYSPNPNAYAVEEAYKAYYKVNPFEKNKYTQYYKRWRRWARPYLQPDGTVRPPSLEQEQAIVNKISNLKAMAGPTSTWSCLGPMEMYSLGNQGSQRITWQANTYGIAIAPSDPNTLYCGMEEGGVFKTTDKGLTWTFVTATYNIGTVRAIAVHPADPNTAYICPNGSIYKTTDGGVTWTQIMTSSNQWVNDIKISAADPNIIIAATNQGLKRSNNGGTSWTTIINNYAWTVAFKPDNANIVYTTVENGSSSTFYKSIDAGASFTPKTTGWYVPASGENIYGVRITVTHPPATIIYALIGGDGDNLNGYVGVWKSTDAGETWTHPHGVVGKPYVFSTHPNLMAHNGTDGFYQGFYDFAIIVSPNDANKLIIGGTSWWQSSDGAVSYQPLGGYVGSLPWSHPDMQFLAAQGNDLWICNDGGINYSNDFASSSEARMTGIFAGSFWGFDAGWNEDVFVGGRYHNGNAAFYQTYPTGQFLRLGGAESATGYVNPGENRRTYFSDIGARILPSTFTGPLGYFGIAQYPNESYYTMHSSAIKFDPRCYSVMFMGNGASFYKSTDGGGTFTTLLTSTDAGASLESFDISRSNPNVMYVFQRSNTLWDGKLWKTIDGGLNWTTCPNPPGTSGGDRRVGDITISATDHNTIWFVLRSAAKVFKSTDGGNTWTNITTATLSGFPFNDICHQYGTDGGVYLGTDKGVFYRNNTMPDWVYFSNDLPLTASTNKLCPAYAKGKLRNGTWNKGVWEVDFYEESTPIAQISVDQTIKYCVKDTFYFVDHSVVNHASGTWLWSFPGASYISSATVYNPKVLYPSSGIYDVSLTVTDDNGSSSQTYTGFITVYNECDIDTIPGKLIDFSTSSSDYLEIPAISGLSSTNTITVTAWVKINGIQPDWAPIYQHDNGTGFGFTAGTNRLEYHWEGTSNYNWNSGYTLNPTDWTHIAWTAAPSGVKFYVNGKLVATHSATLPLANFSNNIARIGQDRSFAPGRNFNGIIEEFCFYDKTLTEAEIRDRMHLTRPANEPNLRIYYQMNETAGQLVYNRMSGYNHASIKSGAIRAKSTCPIAGGVNFRTTVNTPGQVNFTGTDVSIDFTGPLLPMGEVVVNRLHYTPDTLPACSNYASDSYYWILNNYGTNINFSEPASIKVGGILVPDIDNVPSNTYRLHRREFNKDGFTWLLSTGLPTNVTDGTNGSFTYGANSFINTSQQFVVTNPLTTQNITGQPACTFLNTDYNIWPVENAIYVWTITSGDGVIVAGQGTHQITVQWNSGATGTVSVNINVP